MLASELTIFTILTFLFLLVGGVIGWLTKSHLYENQVRRIYMHPEMFDENGNLIPDEILAVRFENDYDDDNDDEEDGD
jgi:Protein of unknown function (DUF2973)